MNIVFVNYHNFKSNSAIHIFNLANELHDLGHDCAVLVPDAPETVSAIGIPRFAALTFAQAQAGHLKFPNGQGPTLLHAWTPRETVRETVEALAAKFGCPIFTHLEDNEDWLTSCQLGISLDRMKRLDLAQLDILIKPTLSHPVRFRDFLARSTGITVITDKLLEFKPEGVPAIVVLPAFERDLFKPQDPDPQLRQQLGISDESAVIVYHGNTHAANAAEVRSLY